MIRSKRAIGASEIYISALASVLLAHTAVAQESRILEEVIVTAQKREQSLQDIGLTIQSASGQVLNDRGIESPSDLVKIVPGFSYTESIWSTPVYTLRGVGLYDSTFGAVPAVAIYTDQIPRNSAVTTMGLDLDIARVEVLKGPQGTLFGQSSTGGAINYITSKPGDEFEAGIKGSFESYERFVAEGYVSGPMTDTLGARLAVRTVQGGAWQQSSSRQGDDLGDADKTSARLTLVWQPSDSFKAEGSVTYVDDSSDPMAPQYVGSILNIYSSDTLDPANPYGYVDNARYQSLTDPASAGYDAGFLGQQALAVARLLGSEGAERAFGANALLGTRTTNSDQRMADWTQGFMRSSKEYTQGTLRLDWEINDHLTLTSVTAVGEQDLDYSQDVDGTAARAVDVPVWGSVESFNQEIRLSGANETVNWIVGFSLDDVDTEQNNNFFLYDYPGNSPFGPPPAPQTGLTLNEFDSSLESTGIFANIEYQLTEQLAVNAGVRYTETKQEATYCYSDPIEDSSQGTAQVFTVLEFLFSGATAPNPILPNQCFPLGDGLSGTTFGVATRDPVKRTDLDEDNISYRLGLNYKMSDDTLFYAVTSRGYKAGVFSAIGASSTSQYSPAVEEEVTAYEAGIKSMLAQGTASLNASVFYYDYKDKQVRGRIADPLWGLLEKMVNVPESYVQGAELEFVMMPAEGLTISASGAYINAEVSSQFDQTADGLPVYNAQGFRGDFDGAKLPFTPEFTGNLDVQYEFPLGGMMGFLGGTVVHTDSQNATFGTSSLPSDEFEIESWTTLDLRAGVQSVDSSWRAMLYGRNVTDEFYTTTITSYLGTRQRFVGRPAIYGLEVMYAF